MVNSSKSRNKSQNNLGPPLEFDDKSVDSDGNLKPEKEENEDVVRQRLRKDKRNGKMI